MPQPIHHIHIITNLEIQIIFAVMYLLLSLIVCCVFHLNSGLNQGFSYLLANRMMKCTNNVHSCMTEQQGDDKSNDYLYILKLKLSKAGQAGLLSYGFLNFLYYSLATLLTIRFAKFEISSVSNLPIKQKFFSVSSQLSKIVLMVWVGSQVTKIGRLILAILFAPTADKALNTIQRQFSLKSRNQTFWILVAGILIGTMAFYASIVVILSLRLI